MITRARVLLLSVIAWPIALIGLLLALSTPTSTQNQDLQLYNDDIPLDAMLLHLDKQALDEAYQDQLKKLFGVWLSQQAQDVRQISNGLRIARRAYRLAAMQIATREQELYNRARQKDELIEQLQKQQSDPPK